MTYRKLNDIMEFDHPIQVNPDGSVEDAPRGIYAPELLMSTQDDGQILDSDEQDFIRQAEDQGWTLLSGWTGQYAYSGVVMHPSEYVGDHTAAADLIDGTLAGYIRDNPGIYVVISVETDDSDEPAGWAIARRLEEIVMKVDKNVTPDLWY